MLAPKRTSNESDFMIRTPKNAFRNKHIMRDFSGSSIAKPTLIGASSMVNSIMKPSVIRTGYEIQKPMMLISNSLPQNKEIESNQPQFADMVSENSTPESRSKPVYSGESFQDYASAAKLYQNMVMHKAGTCPTCHQQLPKDFGKNLNMPPDTAFFSNQVEKQFLDFNTLAKPQMKISDSLSSALSTVAAPLQKMLDAQNLQALNFEHQLSHGISGKRLAKLAGKVEHQITYLSNSTNNSGPEDQLSFDEIIEHKQTPQFEH